MIDIYTFKPRPESCHAQNKEGRDCYSTYRHHTKKIHKRGSLFIHDNTCSLQILNRTSKTRNSSLLVVRFLFLMPTSSVKDKENKKKRNKLLLWSPICHQRIVETRWSWRGWPRRRRKGVKEEDKEVSARVPGWQGLECLRIWEKNVLTGTRVPKHLIFTWAKSCWAVPNSFAWFFKLFWAFFFVVLHCNLTKEWVKKDTFVLCWEEVSGCGSFIISLY